MRAVTDPATIGQLLRRLAPTGAGVAASKVDASFLDELNSQERILVRSARVARQSEFATGRSCAHRALAAIGADVEAIGQGSRRQPIWPDGVTGSISHAVGLAAAVATRENSAVASLGLDVEEAEGVGPELWPQVLTPSESARCRASRHPAAAATAIFSAKEAAFKAVFPLWNAEVEFLDAQTHIGGDAWQVEIATLGMSVAVRQGRGDALVVSLAMVVPEAWTARLSRFAGGDRSEGGIPRSSSTRSGVARL